MRGLNVNGFIVVETLGSGRSGLLYLARHPTTGQEAIIRLASSAEDGLTAKVFLEEASSLLPTAKELESTVASDGSPVLMAISVTPDGPTAPLPPGAGFTQHPHTASLEPTAASPGSGYTQHEHTQRLGASAAKASRVPLLVLLIGLTALGAAISIAVLTARSASVPAPAAAPSMAPSAVPPAFAPAGAAPKPAAATPPTTASGSPPSGPPVPAGASAPPPNSATPTSGVVAAVPTAAAPSTGDQAGAPSASSSARAVAPGPTAPPNAGARGAATVAPPPPAKAPRKNVTCDDRWTRSVKVELNALRAEVARRDDDALYRRYLDDEDRVLLGFRDLHTSAGCLRADDSVDALVRRYQR